MWPVFSQIAELLASSFEVVVILIVMLGNLIFFAVDFKKGIIVMFLSSGAVFMWFYSAGLDYGIPAVLFFMSLVVMSLSLYAISKSQTGAGGMI